MVASIPCDQGTHGQKIIPERWTVWGDLEDHSCFMYISREKGGGSGHCFGCCHRWAEQSWLAWRMAMGGDIFLFPLGPGWRRRSGRMCNGNGEMYIRQLTQDANKVCHDLMVLWLHWPGFTWVVLFVLCILVVEVVTWELQMTSVEWFHLDFVFLVLIKYGWWPCSLTYLDLRLWNERVLSSWCKKQKPSRKDEAGRCHSIWDCDCKVDNCLLMNHMDVWTYSVSTSRR